MAKAGQTGFSVFLTTSVLWQMVKLRGQGRVRARRALTRVPPQPRAHVPSSLLR